jgi:hypothetical protein
MQDKVLNERLRRLAAQIRENGIRAASRGCTLSPMQVSRLVRRCETPNTTLPIDIRDVVELARYFHCTLF